MHVFPNIFFFNYVIRGAKRQHTHNDNVSLNLTSLCTSTAHEDKIKMANQHIKRPLSEHKNDMFITEQIDY